MRFVEPRVIRLAQTQLHWPGVKELTAKVGAPGFHANMLGEAAPDGEALIELAGRLCYRSLAPPPRAGPPTVSPRSKIAHHEPTVARAAAKVHGRPTKDEVFLALAVEYARLSTCRRRRVGCFLVDREHEVLGQGFNGVEASAEHCLTVPCAGATAASGTELDVCLAIHAEANALLRCRDFKAVWTAYCSTAPCVACVKLLLNTGCRRIVFREPYAHAEAERRWKARGREWVQLGAAR